MKAKFKEYLQKFKDLQGSPKYLARGVAIGIFVGFAPLMPLKTAIIVALTLSLSGSTVAGILSCTVICNPITYLPLYYISWWVGDVLFPGRASWEQIEASITSMSQSGFKEAMAIAAQTGFDTGIVVLGGGTILAVPIGILSYPFVYRLFVKIADKRAEKELLKSE